MRVVIDTRGGHRISISPAMIARQLRTAARPSNRLSLLYFSYITLGLTIPFALPAHMTQKIMNDCPDAKGKSSPRCIF